MSLLELLPVLREKVFIVLCSGSARRKEIIGELGIDFLCLPTDVEETMDQNIREQMRSDREQYVIGLAEKKLEASMERYQKGITVEKEAEKVDTAVLEISKSSAAKEFLLFIAADTVVVGAEPERKILEKPVDRDDAKQKLHDLSGKKHEVLTGVAIKLVSLSQTDETEDLKNEKLSLSFFDRTEVIFQELSGKTIEAYVATGEPDDKAGGYGIQSLGGMLVKEIRGCFRNVVGFPLAKMGMELMGSGLEEKLGRSD